MITDPLTGARKPEQTDGPLGGLQIANAVDDLAPNTVPSFTDTAARNTAYANWVAAGNTMRKGLLCHTAADDRYWRYDGSGWKQFAELRGPVVLGPDIGVGTGATAPGPVTAHPPRTIDPGALFGAGYGARVEIDAYILGDCPSGRWDLELVSPALSSTPLRRDSRTFAGRNTLNLSYTDTIPPGTTKSFSTRLSDGTGTLTTYADIVANAATYTVFPYLP